MDAEHDPTTERDDGRGACARAVEAELELLGSPPPSVMAEVARAARRYDELGAQGRRLHFALERGRLRVELRDLEGNVLRAVSPAEALAVAAGATP